MNVFLRNQQQTMIGHLTAHYKGSQDELDKTVLRLRLERLLDNADIRLPGLGSGAILIVRRIQSPAVVSFSTMAQSVPVAWQATLRTQLDSLYASAARPALGMVSLHAPAVLFADPGEMFICLTRDILGGQVDERWYWQRVLLNLPRAPGVALPALWSAQADILPVVLASLHPIEVWQALTQFTQTSIQQVIHALHESFDLPSEVVSVEATERGESSRYNRVTADRPWTEDRIRTFSPPLENLPPWEKWLSTSTLPGLLPQARYLFGLSLTLHHAPAFARSPHFAIESARWLRSEREKVLTTDRLPRDITGDVLSGEVGSQAIINPVQEQAALQAVSFMREAEQGLIRGNGIDTPRSRPEHEPTVQPKTESSPDQFHSKRSIEASYRAKEDRSPAIDSRQDERLEEPDVASTSKMASSPLQQEPLQREAPISLSQTIPSDITSLSSEPLPFGTPGTGEERAFITSPAMLIPSDGVFTRLGGVLYLINVLTRLDLLHSLEKDEHIAEHISGWAIIEVLARCLLVMGKLHEQYVDDPIWHVLALLDGRDVGMPIVLNNRESEENRSFHLPLTWLHPAGPVSWSAIQQGERLFIFDSKAGFLIVDVPLRGRSFFEATHAEVEAYQEQGIEVSWSLGSLESLRGLSREIFSTGIAETKLLFDAESLLAHMDERALWWTERVLGYIYPLLGHALGVDTDESHLFAQLVLCHHGQLTISRTHVDLYMSLEESNIAVRIAGLDRDPAWVPDLARIVYFHFG